MPGAIRCIRMNHINAAVGDFDETVAHFRDVYGAQFLADMPKDEWHACLVCVSGVIFQLFSPHDDLLHARFGPHYVGIEFQVPDVPAARQAVGERGIRIIRELGSAFHVHPLDALGVAFEFYDRSFHTDPPMPYEEPIRPVDDGHPLGLAGLARYSVAVADLDRARTFLEDLTDATVLYEEARPAVGARSVGLGMGDTVVELVAPVAGGEISDHLARYGDGIRSTVFRVRDLRQVERYFAERDVRLRPGDAPGALAIGPRDNRGLMFEFTE